MDKNWIRGTRRRTSRHGTTKFRSIQGVDRQSGGCAWKAAELTLGGLPLVRKSEPTDERSLLVARRESADCIVGPPGTKARTDGAASGGRASWSWPSWRRVGMIPRGPPGDGPNPAGRSDEPKARLRKNSGWREAASGRTASGRWRESGRIWGVRERTGGPSVVEELPGYLRRHWPAIREQLLSGTYTPQPVKWVRIPKPDGGVRKLDIPAVLDRFIQRAVAQVLQERGDRTVSKNSYGFRPAAVVATGGGGGFRCRQARRQGGQASRRSFHKQSGRCVHQDPA